MQLTHVSTNLRQGLRRNASMHAAVVLTLFVSLTLGGLGIMLNQEATKIADQIGDDLQFVVYLCTDGDALNPDCDGEVTAAQRDAIEKAIEANMAPESPNPEVKSYYVESKQTFYDKAKELVGDRPFEGPNAPVKVKDSPESIWITLNDPRQYDVMLSQIQNLPGYSFGRSADKTVGIIYNIIDVLKYGTAGAALLLLLAAIMLVSNTIRLAALARRKEIEIMRLVGASRIFIALPFLLEALVSGLIGVALTGGALAAFQRFGVHKVDQRTDVLPFIGWSDYAQTMVAVAIAGVVLTVLPTLLLTRKYLRV